MASVADNKGTIELDDRMRDETKIFVTNTLKTMKTTDIIHADLKMVRKLKEMGAMQINQSVKLDDKLDISEFFVTSELDGHKIAVTKYVPISIIGKSKFFTVFYHGGGYCFGSRLSHHLPAAFLALKTNSIWISVEYRLCPDVKYPVPFNDCKSVLKWTLENRAELNCDESLIGIAGDSAGAQMAAILAHEFKKDLSYQILVYPVVSTNEFPSSKQFVTDCYLLVPPVIKFFTEQMFDKNTPTNELNEHIKHLSPLNYNDFSNLPKCLIIAAELDPVLDHSNAYYSKLKEENIQCDLKIIKGVIHGFFSLPTMYKTAFNETENYVSEFLNKEF